VQGRDSGLHPGVEDLRLVLKVAVRVVLDAAMHVGHLGVARVGGHEVHLKWALNGFDQGRGPGVGAAGEVHEVVEVGRQDRAYPALGYELSEMGISNSRGDSLAQDTAEETLAELRRLKDPLHEERVAHLERVARVVPAVLGDPPCPLAALRSRVARVETALQAVAEPRDHLDEVLYGGHARRDRRPGADQPHRPRLRFAEQEAFEPPEAALANLFSAAVAHIGDCTDRL
jgi:hypothetical protein